MIRLLGALAASSAGLFAVSGAAPPAAPSMPPPENVAPAVEVQPVERVPAPPARPPKPRAPTVAQAMERGVLMVVSIPAQRIYVFKDGELWDSATVSTGKRGHSTPTGVFPILQKSKDHRSTLYDDAPMPYMQRLTWGGVALHGGNVTRARASHGCIRLPHDFARRLFKITSFASTAVLVTGERVATSAGALALASGRAPRDGHVPDIQLAGAASEAGTGPIRTIQLAATASRENAAALWGDLVERRPELARLDHAIVPAVVEERQVYRLRATGAGAGELCRRLAGSGIACFKVS